jgi:hypothetical protein
MEHSHSVGAFVFGGSWVAVKYFLDQSVLDTLFHITQVRNDTWKSEILGFAQCWYSMGQV